ncbi:MAG: hypothetical protein OEV30_04740, partial [Ignavibacteria bacterium]|nr:hypothetical protein [Ignavibacteria bacterium]
QDELDEIYEDINALDKQEFDTTRFTDYEDRFQILLAIALLFLLVEFIISEKRLRFIERWDLLQKKEGRVSV